MDRRGLAGAVLGAAGALFGLVRSARAQAYFPPGWTAPPVSTVGNGLAVSANAISADTQKTQAVSTSTATVSPTGGQSVAITLSANTTLTISPGYDGQHLRLKLIQDATGSRTVAFDSTVKFGTDVTTFTASTAASTIDIIQLIYDAAHTRWMFAAANHGF